MRKPSNETVTTVASTVGTVVAISAFVTTIYNKMQTRKINSILLDAEIYAEQRLAELWVTGQLNDVPADQMKPLENVLRKQYMEHYLYHIA